MTLAQSISSALSREEARKPGKRRRPERAIHRAVRDFLDYALPPDAWWSTFPSGSGGKARGGQLKAAGLKAGVPDILIVYGGTAYWIEIKGPRGKLSPAQRDTHYALGEAGSRVAMCRSVDEVERYLRLHLGIPLRARLQAA